jgi:hypothetical protein
VLPGALAHGGLLVALTAMSAAACGSSDDVDPGRFEVAIRNHRVVNLMPYGRVVDVACRRADWGSGDPLRADVACTFQTAGARWPRRASCSNEESLDQLVCFGEDAPTDDPVFDRRAWREAPKSVTWKCEDVDEHGRDIGPVIVALRNDRLAPIRDLDWRTKERAEEVAASYKTMLYVDC